MVVESGEVRNQNWALEVEGGKEKVGKNRELKAEWKKRESGEIRMLGMGKDGGKGLPVGKVEVKMQMSV